MTRRTSKELIDEYLADMKRCGRLLSPHSQSAYRHALELHAEDVGEVGLMEANRLHVGGRWPVGSPELPAPQPCGAGSFYTWVSRRATAKRIPRCRSAKRRCSSLTPTG